MDDALVDLFQINVPALIAAFLFGVIGFWMYKEGRRREHTKIWAIGIALMLYPYFVSGAWPTWLVGGALCASAYYYWNR